jgi:hypothetical protein
VCGNEFGTRNKFGICKWHLQIPKFTEQLNVDVIASNCVPLDGTRC